MESGSGQMVYVGERAPARLGVTMTSPDGHPVANAQVTLAVVEGEGLLRPDVAFTDRNGLVEEPSRPAAHISWDDVQSLVARLNSGTGWAV